MSRARARKQQEAEEFFQENPDLRPEPEGPPEIDLSTFEVVTSVGTGLATTIGGLVNNAFVLRDFQGNGAPFGQQSGPTISAVENGGTVQTISFGVAGSTFSGEVEGGIGAITGAESLAPGSGIGLSNDGLGVLGEDEQDQGGQDPFPDGFDRINDDEILAFDFIARSDGTGFNFQVHEGSGTVELVMIGGDGNIVRESVAVDDGFQGVGGVAVETGGFPAFSTYIGVTGDLEISVVGIGYSGEVDPFAGE